MAARANYGFEKRQKEIKRKQKADAKLARRRAQHEGATGSGDAEAGGDATENAEATPESRERDGGPDGAPRTP